MAWGLPSMATCSCPVTSSGSSHLSRWFPDISWFICLLGFISRLLSHDGQDGSGMRYREEQTQPWWNLHLVVTRKKQTIPSTQIKLQAWKNCCSSEKRKRYNTHSCRQDVPGRRVAGGGEKPGGGGPDTYGHRKSGLHSRGRAPVNGNSEWGVWV